MWGHHRQGYCQAGFAAALTRNDSQLLLSGPGAWYWQGMVFAISLANKEILGRYPERSGAGSTDDAYKGYAIATAGHLDVDAHEDLLVSSPRANNCKGIIRLYH